MDTPPPWRSSSAPLRSAEVTQFLLRIRLKLRFQTYFLADQLFEVSQGPKALFNFGGFLIRVTPGAIRLRNARSVAGLKRMRGNEVRSENRRQDFAVHVFRHRHIEQVQKRGSNIDELGAFNLHTGFENRAAAE